MLKLNAKRLRCRSARPRSSSQAGLEESGSDRPRIPVEDPAFSWRKGAIDFFNGSIRGRGDEDNHGWRLAGQRRRPTRQSEPQQRRLRRLRPCCMAIAPTCTANDCRVGWRRRAAASGALTRLWRRTSTGSSSRAASRPTRSARLTYDHGTLYAGTGEPNSSGDSEAGLGIYKSTDNGSSWSLSPAARRSRAATPSRRSLSTRPTRTRSTSQRRSTSVACRALAAARRARPERRPSASASRPMAATRSRSSMTTARVWGATNVAVDTNGDVYASADGEGIYRSHDGGANWELVFQTKDRWPRPDRFALTEGRAHADLGRRRRRTGNRTRLGSRELRLDVRRVPRRLDRHEDRCSAD